MIAVFDKLRTFPRASLLTSPTPVEPLKRLSETLAVELHIKRDDLTGLGMGGNKIRQLEFYFGEALARQADTVLITGAVQSNYVRAAAAAAAKLGMNSVLQLEERVSGMGDAYYKSGNVLLSDLLGARRISYPEGENERGADDALRAEAQRLKKQGQIPYVIPLGLDNQPLGALGYMAAAREMVDAGFNYDAVVVASGSGMTHAGLLVGLRGLGVDTPVYGICVRRSAALQRERISTVCRKVQMMLDVEPLVGDGDVITHDEPLAPGYGRLGTQAREAMTLMAIQEGLFLDPVYTAKSFAGVIGLVRSGVIAKGARVLFVHTGGVPALFAYETEIREPGS